jgi:hypothetical protein
MLLTHEAEPFLRSRQLCSYSRNPQHFMKPESSIPCSQEPSTGPYPELHQSNPYHSIISKINFNTVHPPTSWSTQWSRSFWFVHQYPICIPLLHRSCYMPRSSIPFWLDDTNYTWRRVQVTKLLIMQFSPNLLLLHLSSVQIFPSTPCSQTPCV